MFPLIGVPAAPVLLTTTLLPLLAASCTPTIPPWVTVMGVVVATFVADADMSKTFSHCCVTFVFGARTWISQAFTGVASVYMATVVVVALTGSTVVIAPAY